MKKVLGLMLIVAMVFSLVACGSDELIGSWELKDGGETAFISRITFTEDNIEAFGIPMAYEVKGSKIIVEFMKDEETEWTYEIKKDVLILTVEGVALEYKKVQ